jgi:hypothetical protein
MWSGMFCFRASVVNIIIIIIIIIIVGILVRE